jgi:N-acyl-D-aspartate/D-glutamate deacylase
MLTHPHTVPGLSDGGAHVGTICDVSFPTTLLQWWGRDRPRDRIPLEFLIARQSRGTAPGRGLADCARSPRAKADITDRHGGAAPASARNGVRPAGRRRRMLQRADGYRHTFRQKSWPPATGAIPSRLARRPAAP